MKLLYLVNARIPTEKAHGVQITHMCSAFAKAGLEVELVLPRRINPIKSDPFEYYSIKKKFKITRLPCLDLIPLGLGAFGFWVQTLTFLLAAKIYLALKQYDVLYTRELWLGIFCNNFVLELHKLPHKFSRGYKKILERSRRLIVLTSFIKERLKKEGLESDKIFIAPDGVDLEKFDIALSKNEARRKLNLPIDKILIGYVGMLRTFGMEKGIDVAIRSLTRLGVDTDLVLVGGVPNDTAYYQKMANNLKLGQRVIFIGLVRHELVPMYLKAFDVLIAPFPETEHYKFYMSPLKFFEYMAAAKPIVTTDLPAAREILDENNALLVKPDSPKDLAEGIKRILLNNEFQIKISEQAYRCVQNYTWEKRAIKILNFLAICQNQILNP